MKGYLVTAAFKDGRKEGVFFTDKDDALTALHGQDDGASLAVAFGELYGDEELELTVIEI